ncbi:putative receptor protein kinase [Heracleum sosnowskyi]|uniref:Receptor protein kinase n=1 Tax=Heracleum sosnowskyi TaxID=360622 RepID=A0AAD8MBY3_9APIA|nr:putative receptor protein kinase [Heracleum sosnowskyi]
MPIPRLSTSITSDAMKSVEGNDSLDTFIRQAVGKEPYLSFSRTNDSPVQWIQLLHALDQQDLPGWPLLTPLKVQMQKCDKCSREFCSPINYRRHIRMHRRSLNVDKESHKNRDLLAAFWDKLSFDEAKEIVSFDDVVLEEVTGSSIIKALASFIYKPGFFALSQVYQKAGSLLLDVIQARPSRLPISSPELFSILDDASERTFLCAGTAESMQKYVFDREAGKVALEMKNLVACTSFLMEQKLVKAWLADKDAEALRCQKLLVEEEEASMRRQAELLKRKRQKKLRQKEQKAKEQSREEDPVKNIVDTISESMTSAEPSSATPVVDSHLSGEGTSDDVPTILVSVSNNEPAEIESHGGLSSEHVDLYIAQNEQRKSRGNGRQHLVPSRWQVPKTQKIGCNGCSPSLNLNMVKAEPTQKHSSHRDARAASVSRNKVWTKKAKAENGGEFASSRGEVDVNQIEQTGCAVMIGSISVTVRNCEAEQANSQSEAQDSCNIKHVKKVVAQDKLMKDVVQSSTTRSTVKCWMPVSRHANRGRGQSAIQSDNQEIDNNPISGVGGDSMMPGNGGFCSCEMENSYGKSCEIGETKGLPFSTHRARALLAERWKEAVSGDHVTLVLSPGSDCQLASVSKECSFSGVVDNRPAKTSSSNRRQKAKSRTKPEKNVQIKYIPKQKNVT